MFTGFDAQEVSTEKHVIDLIWRGFMIELKTGRHLRPRELRQLAEFSGAAKSGGFKLAYVFLNKPTGGTIRTIEEAGGLVFYLFD
jgi:hypothetical protein